MSYEIDYKKNIKAVQNRPLCFRAISRSRELEEFIDPWNSKAMSEMLILKNRQCSRVVQGTGTHDTPPT